MQKKHKDHQNQLENHQNHQNLEQMENFLDFDHDIFQAENQTLEKVKIISVQSRQNKKIKSFTNEIKSLTAFYDSPYYCDECKKGYIKGDKHKCPSKCLSCFTCTKNKKCEGDEIICKTCNRKFFGKRCFKNHLKSRSKVEGKTDIVCDTVKQCNDYLLIITGKFIKEHKCSHSVCNNCNTYVGKDHECYLKKVKAKGGYCMAGNNESCKNNDLIKKKDWCYSCGSYSERYVLYDFEATQNTGIHTVNLSFAQDFKGNEYIHNSIEEFCKGFINDKFKGYTFIGHNSKGYDSHFVLKWLIGQGVKPYCLYNEAKIMFVEIPKLSIRFIDSLNFLQMPLKDFSETFGMNEFKIGYFPHYFNKICNRNYVCSIPSKKHYGHNQIKAVTSCSTHKIDQQETDG